MITSRCKKFFYLGVLLLSASKGYGASTLRPQAPSLPAWQAFMHLSPKAQESLWQKLPKPRLSSLTWQWRLGWVSQCQETAPPHCDAVLSEALRDKAALVRLRAAEAMGKVFAGSQNKNATARLVHAFHESPHHKKSIRHKIQKSILYALRQIGGTQARSEAERLASTDPELLNHWQKLSRIAAN